MEFKMLQFVDHINYFYQFYKHMTSIFEENYDQTFSISLEFFWVIKHAYILILYL
jgi:hypothetical protein